MATQFNSVLDRWLLDILTEVYRRTGLPVSTMAVAVRLGTGDRCARRFLSALEARGLIHRVGARGGWLPPGGQRNPAWARAPRRCYRRRKPRL